MFYTGVEHRRVLQPPFHQDGGLLPCFFAWKHPYLDVYKRQEQLNVFRKMALNLIKRYKEKEKSKRPISKIMMDCLLDPLLLASVFSET